MPTLRRTAALAATGTLIATTAAAAVVTSAGPASADVERRGACSTGTWELSADREGRAFEVTVDLDRLPAGSTWRIRLAHEGKVVTSVTRRADREGEIELERLRPNTAGKDTFRFSATRVGGGTCRGGLVTR
ncbi:hypothetical protein [Nocardioides sp.]|uniref:hypothetical protein n=1 Tax=Nocardioides sp. TaxID=35761 RepID=UPI003514B1EC